ncbi:MAG: transposase [Candidatus Hydrogenedentota bacterium]
MSRGPRIAYKDAVYHVLNRFVDKHPFFQHESDYRRFLDLYFESAKMFRVVTYAYCLMPNHFHFCLRTPGGDISEFLRRFLTRASQELNRRHDRTGHLFQGRSKSLVIETESYFETVVAYIILNPVRAGFVRDPLLYPWCSAREMLGMGTQRNRVDRHLLAEQLFGKNISSFDHVKQLGVLDRWFNELNAESNETLFREGHNGRFMSSHLFRKRIELQTERRQRFEETRKRRTMDRDAVSWSWSDLQQMADRFVMATSEMRRQAWSSIEAMHRELTIYIAHELARWTYDRIQHEDGDRHPNGYYSMIVSRMRKDRRKGALAEAIRGTFSNIPTLTQQELVV